MARGLAPVGLRSSPKISDLPKDLVSAAHSNGGLPPRHSLPQLDSVHRREIGRLAGRQDQKIAAFGSSYVGLCTPAINWSTVRPSSRASLAPTKRHRRTPAPHHSTGRALARLPLLIWLLILIHPPLREAERRCSSGDWRAAPFDAVEPIACRS